MCVRTYSSRFLFAFISMLHLVIFRYAYRVLSCNGVDWFEVPSIAIFTRHDGLHKLE